MEIKDRDAQIQKELNKLQEERSKVKLQVKLHKNYHNFFSILYFEKLTV